MSWRTVVVSHRCKLDLKLGYMVIRGETETRRIFLEEVSMLIIEDPAVSLTGCLLVTVNMRSYFGETVVNAFVKTVIDHGIKLLMIEDHERTPVENEKRLIIDVDMCEI